MEALGSGGYPAIGTTRQALNSCSAASAGSFGGLRAAMALRPMLAEMGTSSIPSLMPIPKVSHAFEEDGTPKDAEWEKRAKKFIDEYEWYAKALRTARIRDGKQQCPDRSECEALQGAAK